MDSAGGTMTMTFSLLAAAASKSDRRSGGMGTGPFQQWRTRWSLSSSTGDNPPSRSDILISPPPSLPISDSPSLRRISSRLP